MTMEAGELRVAVKITPEVLWKSQEEARWALITQHLPPERRVDRRR